MGVGYLSQEEKVRVSTTKWQDPEASAKDLSQKSFCLAELRTTHLYNETLGEEISP